MTVKKIFSVLLSITMISASAPAGAQSVQTNKKEQNQLNYFSVDFSGDPFFNLDKIGKERLNETAPAISTYYNQQPEVGGMPLSLFKIDAPYNQALKNYKKRNPKGNKKDFNKRYIESIWKEYNLAVKDYKSSPYAKDTPYQIMNEMRRETYRIAQFLRENPRYQKELKKANLQNIVSGCLTGIVGGLMLVASAYTGGAAASAFISSAYFGFTTSAAAATFHPLTVRQAVYLLAEVELITALGDAVVSAIYYDLTDRLIKYNCISNSQYAQSLAACAAKGSIADENIVENPETQSCPTPQKPNITPNTRWVDDIAQQESVIRLHALRVIRNELQYTDNPAKYDMALLDLASIFSDYQSVEFDESLFTRTIIEDGEKYYQKNTNIVDLNAGRLMKRTKELQTALAAIQKM